MKTVKLVAAISCIAVLAGPGSGIALAYPFGVNTILAQHRKVKAFDRNKDGELNGHDWKRMSLKERKAFFREIVLFITITQASAQGIKEFDSRMRGVVEFRISRTFGVIEDVYSNKSNLNYQVIDLTEDIMRQMATPD